MKATRNGQQLPSSYPNNGQRSTYSISYDNGHKPYYRNYHHPYYPSSLLAKQKASALQSNYDELKQKYNQLIVENRALQQQLTDKPYTANTAIQKLIEQITHLSDQIRYLSEQTEQIAYFIVQNGELTQATEQTSQSVQKELTETSQGLFNHNPNALQQVEEAEINQPITNQLAPQESTATSQDLLNHNLNTLQKVEEEPEANQPITSQPVQQESTATSQDLLNHNLNTLQKVEEEAEINQPITSQPVQQESKGISQNLPHHNPNALQQAEGAEANQPIISPSPNPPLIPFILNSGLFNNSDSQEEPNMPAPYSAHPY